MRAERLRRAVRVRGNQSGGAGRKAAAEIVEAGAGHGRQSQIGKVVGAAAYGEPGDALRAGDMAAYLQILADMPADARDDHPMYTAYLALDRAAAGDTDGARQMLVAADKDRGEGKSSFFIFIDAWLLAIEGKRKRRSSASAPSRPICRA